MASPISPLRGKLCLCEPLAGYTSWRVGGPAERLYKAADLSDLCVFLQGLATHESLFWLGLGSNLLVRDGGILGTVIATHGALQQLTQTGSQTLRVEVGVPCAKVARFSAAHGLAGAEFLAGIPGLMGGALAMNAGAWGDETWARVAVVETVDRHGNIHRRTSADYRIGYRTVQGMPEEWFVAAHLHLTPGDEKHVRARIRDLLAQRAETQPTGVASCGSVFRNPPGGYAARLIETAGLKGACIGAACVSTKHANFIINTGGATAANLEALIDLIRETVLKIHGVTLIPEVQIVGERK